MYKEKYITSNLVTFEQHQLDGWSTDIAQPIRSIIKVFIVVGSLSAYEIK